MKDIASHILDITENSVRANATLVYISLEKDITRDTLVLEIKDDGIGMDADMVKNLTNPFYTTRKTRKVGLGIPLLVQNSEMSGGKVDIKSVPGKGTELKATFGLSHIDRPPEGEIDDVFVNIATGYPEVDFIMTYTSEKGDFILDTREVKQLFEGLPINDLDVVTGLKEIVKNNIKELK
ncbi:ATP-binding protein [Saccharicrinis sp. FJH2]|uniref:ATP-binding protein n=1 Tax=Saccharicrinis sp. FJH65 TaxID=3344659 RepID=UPI0035F3C616